MRLPELGQLSLRQREVGDGITRRRGGVRGPFALWLRSAAMREKVEALGAVHQSGQGGPLPLRRRGARSAFRRRRDLHRRAREENYPRTDIHEAGYLLGERLGAEAVWISRSDRPSPRRLS